MNVNYCESCKHFQHTGETHDGKPYEMGGKCDVKPPTKSQGDYCNGGCDARTCYESRENQRERPSRPSQRKLYQSKRSTVQGLLGALETKE